MTELPFFAKFRRGSGKLDAEQDPLGAKRDLARDPESAPAQCAWGRLDPERLLSEPIDRGRAVLKHCARLGRALGQSLALSGRPAAPGAGSFFFFFSFLVVFHALVGALFVPGQRTTEGSNSDVYYVRERIHFSAARRASPVLFNFPGIDRPTVITNCQ